ncbi:MAG: adenylyltransferase/cytidyltransferase family protein [Cyanobacteria bacterium P01_D01_bin.73]
MIYTLDMLKEAIAQDPDQWRSLVFTNGCFDLLHVGHVRYLTAARKLGKRLVVGLNSDSSVQRLKPAKPGYPERPIVPELQRGEVLAALKPVDGVVIFNEPTAGPTIAALQPDIYVKGGDYTVDTLPETPIVQSYGGEIKLIPVEIATGTSGIVEKILGFR